VLITLSDRQEVAIHQMQLTRRCCLNFAIQTNPKALKGDYESLCLDPCPTNPFVMVGNMHDAYSLSSSRDAASIEIPLVLERERERERERDRER
jgi:hypothetical protein